MPDTLLRKLLFLSCWAIPEVNAFCEPISPPSWSELVRVLDGSIDSGLALLCPFEIRNEGCPSTKTDVYRVSNASTQMVPLHVVCGNFLVGGSPTDTCTIDCPNIAFEVPGFADLTIDSFNILGTTATAIRVLESGRLTVTGSVFEFNRNSKGKGGAIQAHQNSSVIVQSSRFHNNEAESGGAIYTDGNLTVEGATFTNNSATFRGGAIYSGATAFVRVQGSHFQGNQASSKGPVVFAIVRNHTVISSSEACDNHVTTGSTCNGVQDETMCFPTATRSCELSSTAAPTMTLSPTSSSNTVNSQIPSQNPKSQQTPSIAPSEVPSIVPSTSYAPEHTDDSSTPSKTPSSLPSQESTIVSDVPSLLLAITSLPTKMLMTTPTASDWPSLGPTVQPTTVQVRRPSVVPTKLNIGSDWPSILPTTSTSMTQSDLPSIVPSVTPAFASSETPSSREDGTSSWSSSPSESGGPSTEPTLVPSVLEASHWPSAMPTPLPTVIVASDQPSRLPTPEPTVIMASGWPSTLPTPEPTVIMASDWPSTQPTPMPSFEKASDQPTEVPTAVSPSNMASEWPTPTQNGWLASPSDTPSLLPTEVQVITMISDTPSDVPTAMPTIREPQKTPVDHNGNTDDTSPTSPSFSAPIEAPNIKNPTVSSDEKRTSPSNHSVLNGSDLTIIMLSPEEMALTPIEHAG